MDNNDKMWEEGMLFLRKPVFEVIERPTVDQNGIDMEDAVRSVSNGSVLAKKGHPPSIMKYCGESGDPVISMDGLTASWSMDYDKPVLSNISLTVDKV